MIGELDMLGCICTRRKAAVGLGEECGESLALAPTAEPVVGTWGATGEVATVRFRGCGVVVCALVVEAGRRTITMPLRSSANIRPVAAAAGREASAEASALGTAAFAPLCARSASWLMGAPVAAAAAAGRDATAAASESLNAAGSAVLAALRARSS